MKKYLVPLSILPFTAFWLCSFDVFGYKLSFGYAILSLLAGAVINLVAFRGEKSKDIDKRWMILTPFFLISTIFIPYPYNIGLIFFLVAFISVVIRPNLSYAFLASGFLLCIQAIVMSIYLKFIPSMHDAGFLSYAIYPLVKLSFPCSLSNGIIYIQESQNLFPFTTTWDKLGIYPFILIFIPALASLFLNSKSRLKGAAGLLVFSFIYLLLRYVFLINIFFNTGISDAGIAFERMGIFFDPKWLFASFLPYGLIFYPLSRSFTLPQIPRFKFDKKKVILSILIFFAGFFIFGACIFQDPGIEKDGRILVDEIHSIWEPSTLKMDTNWYGENSTYNAYSMVEWLKRSYKVDRIVSSSYVGWDPGGEIEKVEADIISDEITPGILKEYDILILKTPTPYSKHEVNAIVDWVKSGGGLFMIGDHSDFCGTNTSLNQIARNFGIEFEFNSVNAADGSVSTYERGRLPHPCLRYTPQFEFLTSCSIKAPLKAERVIPGYGLMAEPGEFASSGFFRETLPNAPNRVTDRDLGIFHQCVAMKHGDGRVVAFTDSTTISNFRIFSGGSPNLVVGCMEYLNQENRYDWIPVIFLFFGLICLSLFIFLSRQGKIFALLLAISFLSLGCASSLVLTELQMPTYDTIPARYYDWDDTMAFDSYHSTGLDDYTTFFIWTQSLGLLPTYDDSLEGCVDKGKMLVIIDPIERGFSDEEVMKIEKYVQEGGRVLFMFNDKSLGMNLLREFGFTIEEIGEYEEEGEVKPISPSGPSIIGGKALKKVGDRVILSETSYGDGKFLVFTSSNAFKDGINGEPGWFGFDGTVPGEIEEYDLMEIYDLEYFIIENLSK